MCGFAAIFMKDGTQVAEPALAALCDRIVHRGPDDSGVYVDGSVGLGSRRLSIIDLSPAGHMPMCSTDGQLVVAYNGEIYNHSELRIELEKLGHRFRSRTDTEVILAAYQQWGEDCLARFNGMWGFALLDRRRRKLFCARDRFGVKPVHWVELPDKIVFASEMRQLLPLLPARRASRSLLVDFIMTSATDNDPCRSFHADIHKLPASHCLTVDLQSGRLDQRRWYEVANLDISGASEQDLKQEFEQRFARSVELRLRSDVSVGTCLSGGLDSSVIASFASDMHRRQGGRTAFRAVTAVSVDPALDESAYARRVVDQCGLDWIRTRPTQADFAEHVEDVIRIQEEPFPTPSMIMQFFVMKAAREAGITVLLDGQGGDELLLGYPMHRGQYVASKFRTEGVAAAAVEFFRLYRSGSVPAATLLKYVVGNLDGAARMQMYRRRHAYLKSLPETLPSLDWIGKELPPLRDRQLDDVFRNVLPQLLRFEDRNSMAWSIESRLPFLDFNVVEFCLALPISLKLRHGWSKYLLRSVASDRLHADIAWRKGKLGFEAPDDSWLGPHQTRMLAEIQGSQIIEELVDRSVLISMWPSLDRRSQWRLFCCALWERIHGINGLTD